MLTASLHRTEDEMLWVFWQVSQARLTMAQQLLLLCPLNKVCEGPSPTACSLVCDWMLLPRQELIRGCKLSSVPPTCTGITSLCSPPCPEKLQHQAD